MKGGRLYTGTGCRQCRGARVKSEGMQVLYGYRVQAG